MRQKKNQVRIPDGKYLIQVGAQPVIATVDTKGISLRIELMYPDGTKRYPNGKPKLAVIKLIKEQNADRMVTDSR